MGAAAGGERQQASTDVASLAGALHGTASVAQPMAAGAASTP